MACRSACAWLTADEEWWVRQTTQTPTLQVLALLVQSFSSQQLPPIPIHHNWLHRDIDHSLPSSLLSANRTLELPRPMAETWCLRQAPDTTWYMHHAMHRAVQRACLSECLQRQEAGIPTARTSADRWARVGPGRMYMKDCGPRPIVVRLSHDKIHSRGVSRPFTSSFGSTNLPLPVGTLSPGLAGL